MAHRNHRVGACLELRRLRFHDGRCAVGVVPQKGRVAARHARTLGVEHHHRARARERAFHLHRCRTPLGELHVEGARLGLHRNRGASKLERIGGNDGKRQRLVRIRKRLGQNDAPALPHVVGIFAFFEQRAVLREFKCEVVGERHRLIQGAARIVHARLRHHVHCHVARGGNLLEVALGNHADVPGSLHLRRLAREGLVVVAVERDTHRRRRVRERGHGKRPVRRDFDRRARAVLQQHRARTRGNCACDLDLLLHPLERVGGLVRVVLVGLPLDRIGEALDPRGLAARIGVEGDDRLPDGEGVHVLLAIEFKRAAVLVFLEREIGVHDPQHDRIAKPGR